MSKRILLLLSLCLVLGSLAAQAPCQDSVKLEYRYVPGELLRYKMVIDARLQLNAPGSGQSMDLPMRMAGVVKQRTKRLLPDGNAEIVIAFESMRMQMQNEVREMPIKELPAMTLVVSKSGQIQNASIPGMNAGGLMSGQMFSSGGFGHYVVLPTTELRVGDVWNQDVPEIPGLGTIRGTGKLISTNSKMGKYKVAAFKQSIGGDLNMDMPLALPAQAGSGAPPGMKMDGAFLGDGTVYFSVERGQLIRTDGRIDMQINVKVPSENGTPGGNASATMQMAYEMYLLSAGKAK